MWRCFRLIACRSQCSVDEKAVNLSVVKPQNPSLRYSIAKMAHHLQAPSLSSPTNNPFVILGYLCAKWGPTLAPPPARLTRRPGGDFKVKLDLTDASLVGGPVNTLTIRFLWPCRPPNNTLAMNNRFILWLRIWLTLRPNSGFKNSTHGIRRYGKVETISLYAFNSSNFFGVGW